MLVVVRYFALEQTDYQDGENKLIWTPDTYFSNQVTGSLDWHASGRHLWFSRRSTMDGPSVART
jgi:hypothetical protein